MITKRIIHSALIAIIISVTVSAFETFAFADQAKVADRSYSWPPNPNETYPDIPFVKPDGSILKMSELRGYYVVIHYRGMNCPACQNMARVRDLMWTDSRVINVDVLLFNDETKPVTPADAASWARRYNLRDDKHELVVAAPSWTHSPDLFQMTYKMVIGGQLLDKEGVVRVSVVAPKGKDLPSNYWPDLRAKIEAWLKSAQ